MTYRAPINDMLLSLNHGAGLLAAIEAGHYDGYEADFSTSVIEEAGKFATDILDPLNQIGDREGIKLTDKGVVTAPGWPDAYKRWCDGGWNAQAFQPPSGHAYTHPAVRVHALVHPLQSSRSPYSGSADRGICSN